MYLVSCSTFPDVLSQGNYFQFTEGETEAQRGKGAFVRSYRLEGADWADSQALVTELWPWPPLVGLVLPSPSPQAH